MTIANEKQLFQTLRSAGLTRAQAIALLPDWWEPAVARSDSGLWETALMLGRRLSLDPMALSQGDVHPIGAVSELRYKHTARFDAQTLQAATLIASSLARAVLGALPVVATPARFTAQDVRERLFAMPPGRVDFDALLACCWDFGIPVIPLPHLPKGVKKMDAAALKVGTRPAIVITRKNDSKAWLSFLLAHELGHIALGHVPNNGSIVEGSLQDTVEFDAIGNVDQQEVEANEFAHEVLGGLDADAVVNQWPSNAYPIALAAQATDAAPRLRIAPGHLILRYAFLRNRWLEAQTALRFLHDDVQAQATLICGLEQHLDLDRIADDLQDFVGQITGVEAAV